MGKNEIDMLHGPLLMKILVFALPLAASSLLQQFFNSVDIAVVGLFVGNKALAAVGSTAPVIGLFINLMIGLSLGANAIISNHIGQNDYVCIRRAIGTVARLSLYCGLGIAVIGLLAAGKVLELMGTPEEVLGDAVLYLRIYFLGLPFLSVFNFGSAVLRSMGDTRRPLYILLVAGFLNALLNLFFVLVLGMGIVGVAVSTCVANFLSAWVIVYMLLKEKKTFRLNLKDMRIDWNELKPILQIGIPAGVQGMIFSISNVVVQSAINAYGADAMAGSAAALNFEYYCYFVIQAFNGAAISFIGQNYGAGKIDRVRRVFRLCMLLGVLGCGLLNAFFVWQDRFFLGLFTTEEPVVAFGLTRMHIVLITQWIATSYEVAGSSLRGMGYSLSPALITVFGTCLFRILWVFVVNPNWPGFDVLMAVYPVSWGLTGILMLTAYVYITRRAFGKLV